MTIHTKSAGDWQRAAVVVAAGVLASAGLPSSASAQYRSNNDGRALDANQRVGSDGRNDGPAGAGGYNRNGPMVTGNQIITGNVTAGREFRGPVPYGDPSNFRGVTSGSFGNDRFVRDSAGVPRAYGPTGVDLSRPSAFYGAGRAVPPPTGYVPTAGATGGYIPTDSALGQPNLGLARAYSPTLDPALRSSELIMPARDASNQESMLSASPLYGVRVWRAGESPNDFLAGQRDGRRGDRSDRFGTDPNSISRMRDEMNRAGPGNADEPVGVQGLNDGSAPGAQGTDAGGNRNGQGSGANGFQRPLNTSVGGADAASGGDVAPGALQSTLGANPLRGSIATGQSLRQNLLAPDRQTPQLARLRQAYERQQRGAGTASDVEAARQFNRELQASRARPAQGAPGQPEGRDGLGQRPLGGPVGGGGGGVGGIPSSPRREAIPPAGEQTPATPDAPRPDPAAPQTPAGAAQPAPAPSVPSAPERIESIAEGVQAAGLRDVLQSAEELMRGQQFEEALKKYDIAARVAPNNALIAMGRANAELGVSYYRRAESSMRDAVGRAPELVVAQFDLRSLIGPERLQVLVGDLKELAGNDPKAVRPPLLLAYIAYNTGNEAQAGDYLTQAEQRAGADDPLLKAWRRNWKLPTADAPPAANGADQNK